MAALAIDSRIPNKIMSRDQALQEAEQELRNLYGDPDPLQPRKEVPQDPLRGSSNTVKIYERKYGGQSIKFAVREASHASFEISSDNTMVREHVSLLPEYKSDSLVRRTVEREEFLKEVRDTENNWKAAALAGVSQNCIFMDI